MSLFGEIERFHLHAFRSVHQVIPNSALCEDELHSGWLAPIMDENYPDEGWS